MRKFKLNLFISLLLMIISANSFSQDTINNSNDSLAHVYFARVSVYATHAMYYIFHEEELININENINWFKFDCAPGEHLFWITNRKYSDFVSSDLEAGKSYIFMIDVRVGYGKTSVRLSPMNLDDKDLGRAIALIQETDPTETSEIELAYKVKNLKKKNIIKDYLRHYDTDWVKTRKYNFMDATNEIPAKYFK